MSVNRHWARWIFASVSKHFDDRKELLPLYIEGQHRATTKPQEYLELRMDGPKWNEASKGYFIGDVQINILITSALTEEDYHRPYRAAGQVQEACTQTIEVFRFGDGPEDDQSHLGCLQLKQDRAGQDFIELNWFGIIDTNDALVQATVEAHYCITLCP